MGSTRLARPRSQLDSPMARPSRPLPSSAASAVRRTATCTPRRSLWRHKADEANSPSDLDKNRGIPGNWPTAPSCGRRRPGGSIAPPPAGWSYSRRCDRRVAHPNRASATGPGRRRCGLPAPAARFAISGRSTPRPGVSIERANRRSPTASGVTTCASMLILFKGTEPSTSPWCTGGTSRLRGGERPTRTRRTPTRLDTTTATTTPTRRGATVLAEQR